MRLLVVCKGDCYLNALLPGSVTQLSPDGTDWLDKGVDVGMVGNQV